MEKIEIFLNYLAIFIFIFGFLGNTLVFNIYSSDSLNKYSASIFFRAVAIFDNSTLLNLLILYLIQQFRIDLSQSLEFFCKFQTYFFHTQMGQFQPGYWLLSHLIGTLTSPIRSDFQKSPIKNTNYRLFSFYSFSIISIIRFLRGIRI
jgi:hypothetical protein